MKAFASGFLKFIPKLINVIYIIMALFCVKGK